MKKIITIALLGSGFVLTGCTTAVVEPGYNHPVGYSSGPGYYYDSGGVRHYRNDGDYHQNTYDNNVYETNVHRTNIDTVNRNVVNTNVQNKNTTFHTASKANQAHGHTTLTPPPNHPAGNNVKHVNKEKVKGEVQN